jgi:tetratricopeptide (TPR) repeat protein
MRILLFNLGPVEHRIINWGIEGFKTLFQQDIILWGPVPDTKFIFENKEIPILRIFEPTSIKTVFEKLPAGWYPDVVTCETSVLNYIPDIYLCPVKTILFTRDAWSDTIFNKKLVELFDFLSHATIDRPSYNAFSVNMLPLSNCAVTLPGSGNGTPVFEKREIDVIAIANYDNAFYHERYKTFYKLSDSNKYGINIKFFKGINRHKIYAYYQRSKIVIDWAHTLSNRSYEAPLNGCLLFSHENNQLIKDFWIPWEEYVPYNENNVLELITFYIKNPDKAKSIIDRAIEKSKSIASSWGDYVWENINIAYKTDVSVKERIKHIESVPLTSLHHSSATSLLYNYDYYTNFPSDWKEVYFKRIDTALSFATDQSERIAPLIEAARLSFLLKNTGLSIKYLNELQEILPDYAWIYYLRGRISFNKGQYDKALLSIQEAIKCGLRAPDLLQKFVLPLIEKGNPCDGRRITNYMWQPVYNHKNEFQVEALLHLSYELSGYIFQCTEKKAEAVISYTEAVNYVPIPDCIYKANDLLIRSMGFEKILDITGKGIENSPYDSLLVFYMVYALIRLNRRREAFNILNEHRKALKSFVGVKRIVIIRNAMTFIMILILFGKQPGSRIIIEMIRLLKKKLRITYLES